MVMRQLIAARINLQQKQPICLKELARVSQIHQRSKAHEVIFTKNATEALNLVILSWGRANMKAGDTVLAYAHGAPRQHRALAHAGGRARNSIALDATHQRRPTRSIESRFIARKA
jgi:hypothetical protein